MDIALYCYIIKRPYDQRLVYLSRFLRQSATLAPPTNQARCAPHAFPIPARNPHIVRSHIGVKPIHNVPLPCCYTTTTSRPPPPPSPVVLLVYYYLEFLFNKPIFPEYSTLGGFTKRKKTLGNCWCITNCRLDTLAVTQLTASKH